MAKLPLTEDCSGALKNRHFTWPDMNIAIWLAKIATVPASTT